MSAWVAVAVGVIAVVLCALTVNEVIDLIVERCTRKHVHEWEHVGHGSAGWHVYQCRTCPDAEIGNMPEEENA